MVIEDVSLKNATQIFDNQTAVDRRYLMFALNETKEGSMDWVELVWNIASVWTICAGCLAIFVAVLKL
jgi:hypothetical protein